MPRIPPQGWHVTVEHPSTNRTITPDILDEPTVLPSLNSLPEVRVPVRKNDVWLDSSMEDNPVMNVYLDGQQQPIDELREVEDETGRVILHGVGGTELRDRVQQEYTNEERHIAAKNLVTNNTSYAEDVDTPNFDTTTDITAQDTTQAGNDFTDYFSTRSETPDNISASDIRNYQSCFTQEGENYDNQSGTTTTTGVDSFSDGKAVALDTSGDFAEWDFTLDYKIPDGSVALQIRLRTPNNISGGLDFKIDGNDLETGQKFDVTLGWTSIDASSLNGLGSGSYTLRIEQVSSGDKVEIDVVAPYDDRYSYTFDNTVNEDEGYLDGPQLYPKDRFFVSSDTRTAFSIIAGYLEINGGGVAGDLPKFQISNDRGQNWIPASNADNTLDEDFSSPGSFIRGRVEVGRREPKGTRDQTPRIGYESQDIDTWILEYDKQLQLLLLNKVFDDDLDSILTEIASSEYVWSANLDSSGNYQVSWTQPGSRVASDDPDIGDVSISKDLDVWKKAIIKGSNKQISDESFTGDTSFVPLAESNIVPGSESVRNSGGTNFDRSDDYEMDYTDGEIKITSNSAMTQNNSYLINYGKEVRGSYTEPGASGPDELVETINAVQSNRLAQQFAFTIVDDFADPRYSGTLRIPRADVTFDPLEALNLTNLNLPTAATPLEISGSPEITPEGIRLRLESRSEVEERLSRFAEQLRSLSKNV
jgi:hypothetical protein